MEEEHLLEQHGLLVWRVIVRIIGDGPDAADCFQDTFLAYLRIARSKSVLNPGGLLRRIATTRSIDRLRRRARDRRRHSPDDQTVIVAPDHDPAQNAEQRELVDWLRTALAGLPRKQALVFTLHHLDQLSYDEIAEQTGMSISHVGVLLHRARTRLKATLLPFAAVNE